MRSELKLRLRILSGAFICVALLLVLRLYLVQIVHGAEYREDAMGQYVALQPDTDARGSIFFTAKDGTEVAAAVMQTGWRLAIDPKLVVDPQGTYKFLKSS
jgi:cell division protein FtsI/penicillin-binding protein 2